MARVLLIAGNAFRGVMSKRALYIWAAAVVLMFLRSGPAIFAASTEPAFVLFIRANAVSGSLDLWGLLCLAAAIFLGAGAIASEVSAKTIVAVLARPIRRWELLAGKWLGLTAFCALTVAIGVGLAVAMASYLGIEVNTDVLAIAVTRTLAAIVLYCGVAVAISSLGTAMIAGALTVLLAFLPPLITTLVDDPGVVQHRIGVALDYVVPPGYRSQYGGVAWAPFPTPPNFRGRAPAQQAPVVDYPGERKQAALTLGYAVVFFVAGCALFSRRDVKLG
jgi:ABC-type transport system involved in multi-copper enzyme maturation permease subunit